MFDKFFFNSFALTLIISCIYILKNLYLANNFLNYLTKKNIFNNFEFNFLVCFYLIFLIECFIFNWFVFFNFKINIFYIYFILKTIYFLFLLSKKSKRINFTNIFNIFRSLKLEYKDISQYILAFIHKSIVNERPDFAPTHNERLEFL